MLATDPMGSTIKTNATDVSLGPNEPTYVRANNLIHFICQYTISIVTDPKVQINSLLSFHQE